MAYSAEIALNVRLENATDAIKNLDKVDDKFDEAAAAAKTLDQKLDDLDTAFSKAALAVQGMTDVIEGSSRLVQQHGAMLGLTKEEIEALNQKTEEFVQTMQSFSMILMGVADLCQVASVVMGVFKTSHAATTATTVAGNQAMSVSFLGLQISMGPLILVILAIIAAVVLLYFAWNRNWGGIRDSFKRVYDTIKPGIEALRRVMKKLGMDVDDTGGIWKLLDEIMDNVFRNILERYEPILIRIAECIVALAEALEWAVNAWDEFWQAQREQNPYYRQAEEAGRIAYGYPYGGNTTNYNTNNSVVVNTQATDGKETADAIAFKLSQYSYK